MTKKINMNDEYTPPNESDNESISSAEDDTIEIVPHEITHDDLIDFDNDIYIWMDTYIRSNILKLSTPNFYDIMLSDITIVVYQYLEDAHMVSEEDYVSIQEYIDILQSIFLDTYEIPRRSITYTTPSLTLYESTNNNNNITEQIVKLRIKNSMQPKQKTKEWYEARYGLLTASAISKIFSSQAQINSIIYEKCKPFEMSYQNNDSNYCNTLSPMHWGVKYEQVTVMIYEMMFQTKIEEFGCIPHDKCKCIGASPDGINVDINNPQRYGRMLEIKNIFNRDITGIPKEEYWVQTQIQMETCDLDECDFVETRFKEFPNEEAFYNDTEHEYRGIILQFIHRTVLGTRLIQEKKEQINNAPMYKYMPLNIELNRDAIREWIGQIKTEVKEKYVLLETQYWYLDELSCILIPRNRFWFAEAAPIIEKTWETIETERVEGYSHRAPTKRIRSGKIEVTSETDTNSYMIHNLELSNTVCLVKLEYNKGTHD